MAKGFKIYAGDFVHLNFGVREFMKYPSRRGLERSRRRNDANKCTKGIGWFWMQNFFVVGIGKKPPLRRSLQGRNQYRAANR
jgi:hypothetical protein